VWFAFMADHVPGVGGAHADQRLTSYEFNKVEALSQILRRAIPIFLQLD
jgi:hypothetical protein